MFPSPKQAKSIFLPACCRFHQASFPILLVSIRGFMLDIRFSTAARESFAAGKLTGATFQVKSVASTGNLSPDSQARFIPSASRRARISRFS